MERIDPFGRTFAVPPPFSETVLPGGVWLPTLPRLAVAGRPPAAPGRPPPAAGRPAAAAGRLPVVVCPAAVPGRLPAAVPGRLPAAVPGRLPVAGWLPVVVWLDVLGWLPVVVCPAVLGLLPVVPWEGVEVCDWVAPCEGVELWDGAEECAGALACGAGALLVLCCPHANVGTTKDSRSTSPFCIISPVEVRFITAS